MMTTLDDDNDEALESVELAAGLLRGEADIAAGRVRSNHEAQALLRARIAAAANPDTDPRAK